MKVLVVESEDVVRKFQRLILTEEGIEVSAVHSAAEGIDQFSENSFDVVSTDLRGDGTMEGPELLKRLGVPNDLTGALICSGGVTRKRVDNGVIYMPQPISASEYCRAVYEAANLRHPR